MILPWTKGGLSLAFLSALLFCCIVLFKLLIYAKETIKLFYWVVDKAIFPHFKHDNSVNVQYFAVKLSGRVVTALVYGMN